MRRVFPVLLIVMLCSSACIFSDPGGSPANNGTEDDAGADAGTDTSAEDTSGDQDTSTADSSDVSDDTDAQSCDPITECDENQCGTIDDGCGGTLQCENSCSCVDGEPQQDTCGSCGLGVLECGRSETGSGTCVTPPLPDSLACEDVLYVETDLSSDGDGSASSPFASYVSAFAEASAGQTIVIGGNDPVESMIEVKDGVSVYGGYDVQGDSWVHQPDTKQGVEAPASSTGDTYGLTAIDLTQETVVYGLDISTDDAAEDQSYNNYGAYVTGTNTLTLEFVDVFAGRGGSGADGTAGGKGADGQSGQDAPKAHEGCGLCTNGPVTNQVDGGAGGENTSCPSANGGAGGEGGTAGIGSVTGQDAQDGADTSAAQGGRGGLDSAGNYAGEAGDTPDEFQNAASDGDAAQPGGAVTGRSWVPAGAGEAGADGAFGPGGGGGGGASNNTADDYDVGPGGAGGGAGGCGGTGGEGGQPGGGSFGLFTIGSEVTLVRVRFNASAGGKGGAGASGGAGGAGGDGGLGTNEMEDYGGDANTSSTVTLPYSSGNGGDGVDGQHGGWGAGGAGGVSYGAYCENSTLDTTDVEFKEGAVASGGSSVGEAGPDGLAVDMEGCQ